MLPLETVHDALIDSFGRVASDLRISLTDKCSLRCTYCMPAEGLPWLRKAELLTDDEIVRLAGVFASHGVTSIRLTGGEPLLHRTLAGVVARLAALAPRPELSLTTNGVGLVRVAEQLVRSGLDRVNVSVDTLDPERFRELTRRDRLADVLAGVASAAAAGLSPVKVNAVLMRGSNLAEAPELLAWALRSGYQMRFIEHMPLDAQHEWSREAMVTADEMLTLLGEWYTLRPIGHGHDGSAPAEDFEVLDGPDADKWPSRPGRVGVIASVTRPFCRECGPLRDGATDPELVTVMRDAVAGKQAGHSIGSSGFLQPIRPMSAIGG